MIYYIHKINKIRTNGKEVINMTTYEEMKKYIKENGYTHLVAELNDGTEEGL